MNNEANAQMNEKLKELHKLISSRHLQDVLVKVNGELIPIRGLPKDEYEQFLDIMFKLRLAYISAITKDKAND